MKKYLDRVDRFLDLFERFVRCEEAAELRALHRDEQQQMFFGRYAEAMENMASTSHAQTAISKKTADALVRSLPPEGYEP